MHSARKILTTLGVISLAACLIAVLAPKAVHGLAAALVQVTNTAANPVPTIAADSSANFPFAASVCAQELNTDCTTLGQSSAFTAPLTTSTGLPVKRVVIENVSGLCDLPTAGTTVALRIALPFPVDNSPDGQTSLMLDFPLQSIGPRISAVSTPTRIYVDPGATVGATLPGMFVSPGGASCQISYVGHLETK
jgi:hypothetical protein